MAFYILGNNLAGLYAAEGKMETFQHHNCFLHDTYPRLLFIAAAFSFRRGILRYITRFDLLNYIAFGHLFRGLHRTNNYL